MDLIALKRKVDTISANIRIREKDKKKALERLREKYGVEDVKDAVELMEKTKKQMLQIRKQRDHYLRKIEKRIQILFLI